MLLAMIACDKCVNNLSIQMVEQFHHDPLDLSLIHTVAVDPIDTHGVNPIDEDHAGAVKKLGRLPFSKELRSSSIFKTIEVFFHISSGWVGTMLHTKNQLPGCLEQN